MMHGGVGGRPDPNQRNKGGRGPARQFDRVGGGGGGGYYAGGYPSAGWNGGAEGFYYPYQATPQGDASHQTWGEDRSRAAPKVRWA